MTGTTRRQALASRLKEFRLQPERCQATKDGTPVDFDLYLLRLEDVEQLLSEGDVEGSASPPFREGDVAAFCPECEAVNASVDEDGCCASCGHDAMPADVVLTDFLVENRDKFKRVIGVTREEKGE